MGKILSIARNPFRNFNVENRAHKVISQSKPVPAPKHLKDQFDCERLMREHPEMYEESLRKNEQLDHHLKSVYVTSNDPNIQKQPETNPNRPLPVDRSQVEDFAYGAKEPNRIPPGKVTLKKALEFISNHQSEPEKYTIGKISDEHLLAEEKVRGILKYFRVFQVYIPTNRESDVKFAGPSLPQVKVKKRSQKKLPKPDNKDET